MGKSLEDYKKMLDNEKAKEQKLIGQQEMLMKRLKEEGFETIDQAIKKLKKLGKEIDEMTIDLKDKKIKFEKTYGELLNG